MDPSISSIIHRRHPRKPGSIPQLSHSPATHQVATRNSTIDLNKINFLTRDNIILSSSSTLMTLMSTGKKIMVRRMAAVATNISSPSSSRERNSTKCTISRKSHLRDSTKRTTMRRGRCLAMNDTPLCMIKHMIAGSMCTVHIFECLLSDSCTP